MHVESGEVNPMQYQIFVQNPEERHFTASVLGMPACVAEGHTEAEAVANAEVLLDEQLAKGKIVTIDKPEGTQSNGKPPSETARRKGDFSSLPAHGIFKDDPTFDDFVEKMAEFRANLNMESQDKKHALMQCAGMWANDPDFDEFVAEMKQIREEEDREDQS
jgi:predicted RNase H-like HicB family nuclease